MLNEHDCKRLIKRTKNPEKKQRLEERLKAFEGKVNIR